MIEIRFHGRGGQGAVTAAEILAKAVFEEDKYTQAFPSFGVERRGAPVTAFARISDKPIRRRYQIYEPKYVVVLDETLANVVDLTSGLKDDGSVLVNTERDSIPSLDEKNIDTHLVDATGVALDIIGRNIVNTTMLGFLSAKTNIVKIDSLLDTIKDTFSGKVAKTNVEATEFIYNKYVNE
ncbi:pyruvate ferredoxin oxidoreductase subunit gamma [Candidatus Methanosphaera massiliense]|jgi:pyruvate ferredoxin oxidoreductase gamma subunit|uniref:pyruvate ferredoxin oxidoreductase subunit gamma n=1 Tax=Methanosphaera TaxID=2316 RepID=UPI000DC2E398|nr:pyruvate ferredoxin oxidoreductase subunit gamma [Candidatus Methanosphaera massiliense]MDE4078294.1 pyruvate ferredoxin oxidoreductase subunit gamma [Candidatus Methanosphaera massiliense]RAP44600.1 MAG: pyruvate ferredoxin oxidoreductase [Methanosphaera sp. SHI1033]